MGKKRDIHNIEAIAKEFGFEEEERRDFGDYIEECKKKGDRGSGKKGTLPMRNYGARLLSFRGEKDERNHS